MFGLAPLAKAQASSTAPRATRIPGIVKQPRPNAWSQPAAFIATPSILSQPGARGTHAFEPTPPKSAQQTAVLGETTNKGAPAAAGNPSPFTVQGGPPTTADIAASFPHHNLSTETMASIQSILDKNVKDHPEPATTTAPKYGVNKLSKLHSEIRGRQEHQLQHCNRLVSDVRAKTATLKIAEDKLNAATILQAQTDDELVVFLEKFGKKMLSIQNGPDDGDDELPDGDDNHSEPDTGPRTVPKNLRDLDRELQAMATDATLLESLPEALREEVRAHAANSNSTIIDTDCRVRQYWVDSEARMAHQREFILSV